MRRQVGYNKGDGVVGHQFPLSLTPGILFINSQTNAGVTGRWMYRVGGSPPRCFLDPTAGKLRGPNTGQLVLLLLNMY